MTLHIKWRGGRHGTPDAESNQHRQNELHTLTDETYIDFNVLNYSVSLKQQKLATKQKKQEIIKLKIRLMRVKHLKYT